MWLEEIICTDWAIGMIYPIYEKLNETRCNAKTNEVEECSAQHIQFLATMLNISKTYSENFTGEYQVASARVNQLPTNYIQLVTK